MNPLSIGFKYPVAEPVVTPATDVNCALAAICAPRIFSFKEEVAVEVVRGGEATLDVATTKSVVVAPCCPTIENRTNVEVAAIGFLTENIVEEAVLHEPLV